MNPIDELVGLRIRERRKALRMSLAELARNIGVSSQQLQKYERGTNQVSASRLHLLAHALGVGPAFFFESALAPGDGDELADLLSFLRNDETRELITAFRRIESARLRRSIVAMIQALVGTS